MVQPVPFSPLTEAEFQALTLPEREAYVKRLLEDLDARIAVFQGEKAQADSLFSLPDEPAWD